MAIVVRLTPAVGGLPELLLKACVGAGVYILAALAFNVAGARHATQQFIQRRAQRV